MACEPTAPQFGCCGGDFVPCKQVFVFCYANLNFTAFAKTPGTCFPFYKTRILKVDYIHPARDQDYKDHTTTRFDPPRANKMVITQDALLTFPGFFAEPFQGWETDPPIVSDPPYGSGPFVGFRKYRPNGSAPGDPWWYQVDVTYEDEYTEPDAMADFMALFNQVNVMDLSYNLCRQANGNLGGQFSYDQNGEIVEGAAGVRSLGIQCRDGPLPPVGQVFSFCGAQAGFAMAVGHSTGPVNTDMGIITSGILAGRKLRIRTDRNACVWKYEFAAPCLGVPSGAGMPVCAAPSCTFISLPTQDVPGCTAIWPRYVEFALLPDGVDPETGLGTPAPGSWYIFAACTECFTSR